MKSPHGRANRLANESSPYLRQHAHNPVDWYPWGPEALAKAKAENKPILLSVGYSACHWCHVMAHECFENEAIAAQMNAAFVNIKVDREERPDVDEVYQRVTQIISGQGGWPLTVFLDPEGKPVYGGTYFPPDERYGRPGFPRVIEAVLDAVRNRPDEAATSAKQIVERMRLFDATEPSRGIPARSVLASAADLLKQNFDVTYGGFGTAPKFPMVADMELLLAEHRAAGDQEALDMVLFTLQKMATGGIYDQLGGGFHRYSVDPYWLVPHFEKMLYDNALLPRVFLEAFRLTKDGGYARIATETLNYLLREMRAPDGGFYSAQDADSEGEEGKFFVWQLDELKTLLGPDRAARFAAVYDVTADGNWEHKNILRIVRAPDEVAREHGLTDEAMANELTEARKLLLAARDKRIKPGRDDKRITAWNGLALSTFARAGALLEHPAYLDVARETATFILERCFDGPRSRLRRIFHADEGRAKIDGFLDDYAYAAIGLLDLHRATGEPRWGREAVRLLSLVEELFFENGALYLTPKDGEALPARPRSGHDQMLPSPAAAAVEGFWRAYVLTDKAGFREAAERALAAYGHEIERHPTAYAGLAAALDLFHRGQTSCVVTGALNQTETQRLGHAARRLLPNDEAVLIAAAADGLGGHLTEGKRTPTGVPAAFLCQGYACQPPAMTPEELAERLKE